MTTQNQEVQDQGQQEQASQEQPVQEPANQPNQQREEAAAVPSNTNNPEPAKVEAMGESIAEARQEEESQRQAEEESQRQAEEESQRQAAEAQRVEQERQESEARAAEEKRRQEAARAANGQQQAIQEQASQQEDAEASADEDRKYKPLTPIDDIDFLPAGTLGATNVFGNEPGGDPEQESGEGPEEEGGGLFAPIPDGEEVAIAFSEGITGVIPVPVAVDNIQDVEAVAVIDDGHDVDGDNPGVDSVMVEENGDGMDIVGHAEVVPVTNDGGHDATGEAPAERPQANIPPAEGDVQQAAKTMGHRSGQVRRSRPKPVIPQPDMALNQEKKAKKKPPPWFKPPRLPGQHR